VGGLEVGQITKILVLEALSRIDGSTGWAFGHRGIEGIRCGLSIRSCDCANVRERGPADGGCGDASRSTVRMAGEYRVGGPWTFGSGIHHAQYVAAAAFVSNKPPPRVFDW